MRNLTIIIFFFSNMNLSAQTTYAPDDYLISYRQDYCRETVVK